MNLSDEEAAESLASVKDTAAKTRRAVVSAYESPFLIIWGLVWVLGFLGTHLFLEWVNWIWGLLSAIGVAATIVICWRLFHLAPATRSCGGRRLGLRTSLFWPVFFLYAFVWLNILQPHSGIQLNAFLCTAIMFAYVAIGLWFDSWLMVFLGLGVTVLTLVGFFVIPLAYYSLWMAIAAGGPLLATGICVRIRWR